MADLLMALLIFPYHEDKCQCDRILLGFFLFFRMCTDISAS